MDSIFNQTLSDIEIIIADDASTDSTPQIATELAKTFCFCRFLPTLGLEEPEIKRSNRHLESTYHLLTVMIGWT